MEIKSDFGNYSTIKYDTSTKEGRITLFYGYSAGLFFGGDVMYASFEIGGVSDLFELYKGLKLAIWKRGYTFSNYLGKYIFITRKDNETICVQQGNERKGEMSQVEVKKFFGIIKDILRKIGVSYQEIQTKTWIETGRKRGNGNRR